MGVKILAVPEALMRSKTSRRLSFALIKFESANDFINSRSEFLSFGLGFFDPVNC